MDKFKKTEEKKRQIRTKRKYNLDHIKYKNIYYKIKTVLNFVLFIYLFWHYWNLNAEPSVLLLEPYPQHFLLWLFVR
jgi:hypothetical protein